MEDLNAFCIFTQQVKADTTIPEEHQAREIVGRLIASKPGPDFLTLLRSLTKESSGESRYRTLKQAAAERGAPRWSCPALMD